MSFEIKPKYNAADLVALVTRLRDPETGCPWDAEQNHKSIRNDLLEEAYEVADAIDRSDDTDLLEELGDLLFQVVFHAEIAREAGKFDLDDVADGVSQKMVLRHPHVFGDVEAETSEEVLTNWDAIKREEKHQSGLHDELLAVPQAFPALMRGQKLIKRATRGGALPADPSDAKDEAVQKFESFLLHPESTEALGGLLLSLCRIAHLNGINAEESLSHASEDFIQHHAKEDT